MITRRPEKPMSQGERMVWAAEFAASLHVCDPLQAAARAYRAVEQLWVAAQGLPQESVECMAADEMIGGER